MKFFKTEEEKMKKMFFDNLDRIYSTSEEICKEWDKKSLPLITLKTIIDSSKPKLSGITDVKTHNIIEQFNTTLNSLYHASTVLAKKMHSKSIPLSELKKGIDIIKGGFNDGLKN